MFKRVDMKQAGPTALGILIPQGMRTPVIVRPRALPWDLLPARWDGDAWHRPQFSLFTRDEAAGVARRLIDALDSAARRGIDPMESFGDAELRSLQLWLRTDEFVWIVCQRAQGVAYQTVTFVSLEAATQAAGKIAASVCPAGDTVQEYYFNTQSCGEW